MLNPMLHTIWSLGPVVKTLGFHPDGVGSTPAGITIYVSGGTEDAPALGTGFRRECEFESHLTYHMLSVVQWQNAWLWPR